MTNHKDNSPNAINSTDLSLLMEDIRAWGRELGFQQIGISDIDLDQPRQHLQNWLEKNFHGDMDYMANHGEKRSRPEQLLPGTLRVLSARMDYLPDTDSMEEVLADKDKAYISRYALGRDYHKLMRKRLATLAQKISEVAGQHNHRAFVDSAPVLERALAEKAGLGWIGKNTMLINPKAGSWFFLGEIYTDLPLPLDPPQETMHCGTCTACLDDCPTGAIVAPNQVDARRCISYLTIELRESIPEDLRPLMGNRIYGCDDCQLVCPWNKFSEHTEETDFQPRNNLQAAELIELFQWTEEEFLKRTEGSAIRRIGYESWLRNIAVALGNAPTSETVTKALTDKESHPSALVREHVIWALKQH
ncbi:MAG: tRNA epoxyqueuosine(34) reductase QueG [Oceanicoccus sp.]|uniref:tRNA epoxyqueuosine(34) reductase QueG n=1 Tax=Oceanicoccus sp. TaxID=2691044 RepID=UPI00260CBFFB|nr:tRNA epoxyqueuosine(34) reductase QueG [Oceanicoccus sp.]MCP3907282.1 tRNA epoxyqueuosine(34) reductase QueG [Oceanicoccus sp.]MDG1772280.1 tRNA epoxyqueuosine(34) reductase QueG [Oceanicoccus sp.]